VAGRGPRGWEWRSGPHHLGAGPCGPRQGVGGAAAVRSTVPEKEGGGATPLGGCYHDREHVNEHGHGGPPLT
jgi:hypothetical protein